MTLYISVHILIAINMIRILFLVHVVQVGKHAMAETFFPNCLALRAPYYYIYIY